MGGEVKAVIYRGETYLRAKNLNVDANSNIEIQAVCHAHKPRPAKGFGRELTTK